ncbi:MAG: head maturation protease, ClpP-related [Pseudomonadota bacterium]
MNDRRLASIRHLDIRTEAPITGARGYSMKAAGKTGEIVLYDSIGADWFGGISATQFKADLDKLGAVTLINLRINSPGGQVFDGLTMHNLLASHKARIVTHIDGLAASIASVIAMAGDEIRIADNAMMMIHNAAGGVFGGSEEMRKTADLMDTISASICGIYCKRNGKTDAAMAAMMDDETWMTAADAVKCGLADKIVDPMNVENCLAGSRLTFKRTPETLKAISNTAPKSPNRFAAKFEALRSHTIRAQTRR